MSMSVGKVNISDSEGSNLFAMNIPVAYQDGKVKLDLTAPDYKLRARLDTLIKSGAVKVDGDPDRFLLDVLEGAREARGHGDTSVSLDDVALADFTLDDAACAKRLGGSRPAEVNPFKNTVDKDAYALINNQPEDQTASPEAAGEKILAEIVEKYIGPLKNLNIHI
jgi:hypothetical protein